MRMWHTYWIIQNQECIFRDTIFGNSKQRRGCQYTRVWSSVEATLELPTWRSLNAFRVVYITIPRPFFRIPQFDLHTCATAVGNLWATILCAHLQHWYDRRAHQDRAKVNSIPKGCSNDKYELLIRDWWFLYLTPAILLCPVLRQGMFLHTVQINLCSLHKCRSGSSIETRLHIGTSSLPILLQKLVTKTQDSSNCQTLTSPKEQDDIPETFLAEAHP